MKQILIATHGKMASGIRYTAELIVGQMAEIETIDAYVTPEDNVEEKFKEYFQKHEHDRVIVFTDLMGGSVNQKLMEYSKKENVTLITGTNLPMLMQVMLADDDVTDEEIQEYIDDARNELQMVCLEEKKINTDVVKEEKNVEKEPKEVQTFENSTAKIAALRVDDRLIHGQVATVWSKEANAQRIIICSDEVAKDQIRKTLLLQVGPPGVKVSVVDVAKAVRVYNNPKYEKDTVFFLYTCPQDVLRMAEAGVPIKSVNIGGMAFKTGKTQITKAVSVDESDIAAFKKLNEMGIELEIRPVATDKKVDLMSKIEGIEG